MLYYLFIVNCSCVYFYTYISLNVCRLSFCSEVSLQVSHRLFTPGGLRTWKELTKTRLVELETVEAQTHGLSVAGLVSPSRCTARAQMELCPASQASISWRRVNTEIEPQLHMRRTAAPGSTVSRIVSPNSSETRKASCSVKSVNVRYVHPASWRRRSDHRWNNCLHPVRRCSLWRNSSAFGRSWSNWSTICKGQVLL